MTPGNVTTTTLATLSTEVASEQQRPHPWQQQGTRQEHNQGTKKKERDDGDGSR